MPQSRSVQGGDYALGAALYFLWGIVPAYFKQFHIASPYEVVIHRIIWSFLFLLLFVLMTDRLGELKRAASNGRVIGLLALSSLLISVNWLLNVIATVENHIFAVSFAFFLAPLFSVALGVLIFHENVSRAQTVAIGFAGAGVALMAITALTTLWMSIGMAVCFSVYGVIRKVAPVEATAGLVIETALMAPLALIWMLWIHSHGTAAFGQSTRESLLLVSSGIVLMAPLLVFGIVVRRLPLVAVGLLQFIAPSVTFAIALFIYHEPLGLQKLISFILIWIGLAIFCRDVIVRAGAARKAART